MAEHEFAVPIEASEWFTPPQYFRALRLVFDLDPCSPGPGHWVPARKIIVLIGAGRVARHYGEAAPAHATPLYLRSIWRTPSQSCNLPSPGIYAGVGDEMRAKKGSQRFVVMMARAVPAAFRRALPSSVDPVLTEDETAQLLGVSKWTMRRENKAGRGVPRVRLSQRRIGYRLSAINARLDASTENPHK